MGFLARKNSYVKTQMSCNQVHANVCGCLSMIGDQGDTEKVRRQHIRPRLNTVDDDGDMEQGTDMRAACAYEHVQVRNAVFKQAASALHGKNRDVRVFGITIVSESAVGVLRRPRRGVTSQ